MRRTRSEVDPTEERLLRRAIALAPEVAAATTMFTSCQPCGMCSGAIARSGLGRVVFALSNEQHAVLVPGESWPSVPVEGPFLYDEARVPIEGYYGS